MILTEYEEIVNYEGTPLLVLSGPGTGKTFLLADRVNRLLNKGVNKKNIMVITFGKEASQEMINLLIDPKGKFKLNPSDLPNISTMHSLGNSIVLEKPREVNLLKTNLKVQPDEDIKKILYRDAAYIVSLNEKDSKMAMECKQYGDCQKDKNECKICFKYREIMSKCNYIDFDDQILFACEILKNNETILRKYQKQSQHLLVDEYQDINTAQFRLIELLSRESRGKLFVVGDDAQSIYKFRGCDPKFILRFMEDYPDAKKGTLNVSRRCHKGIIDDAFKILEKYYKDWSGKPKDLKYKLEIGDKPIIYRVPSEKKEAKIIVKIAFNSLKEEKSVLVLIPNDKFLTLLINELDKKGVLYDCYKSLIPKNVSILEKFFKWLTKPEDNFTTRLIIEYLMNNGAYKVVGVDKNPKICKQKTIENRIIEEKEVAELWNNVDTKNSLYSILKESNNNKTISSISGALQRLYSLNEKYNSKNKVDFLKHLSYISGIWCKPKKLMEDIFKINKLLEIRKIRLQKNLEIKSMRKAKGLTRDVVIVLGLEDDIVPDPRGDLIEEARLFYVSMTRAREKLYLVHSYQRQRGISFGEEIIDKKRSRFLDVLNRKSEWKQY